MLRYAQTRQSTQTLYLYVTYCMCRMKHFDISLTLLWESTIAIVLLWNESENIYRNYNIFSINIQCVSVDTIGKKVILRDNTKTLRGNSR